MVMMEKNNFRDNDKHDETEEKKEEEEKEEEDERERERGKRRIFSSSVLFERQYFCLRTCVIASHSNTSTAVAGPVSCSSCRRQDGVDVGHPARRNSMCTQRAL